MDGEPKGRPPRLGHSAAQIGRPRTLPRVPPANAVSLGSVLKSSSLSAWSQFITWSGLGDGAAWREDPLPTS